MDTPVTTKALGQGYEFQDYGNTTQGVYRNQERLNRGHIDLLYYDERVIIGFLSTEDDGFDDLREKYDLDGYFIIDKSTGTFKAAGL